MTHNEWAAVCDRVRDLMNCYCRHLRLLQLAAKQEVEKGVRAVPLRALALTAVLVVAGTGALLHVVLLIDIAAVAHTITEWQ